MRYLLCLLALLLGALFAQITQAQAQVYVGPTVDYTDPTYGLGVSGDYSLADRLANRLAERRAAEAAADIRLRESVRNSALLREWLCKRFCATPPVADPLAVDPLAAPLTDPLLRRNINIGVGGGYGGGAVIVDPTQRAVYSGPIDEQALADRYNARARAEYRGSVRPVNVAVAAPYYNGAVPYTDPVAGQNTGAIQTVPGQGGQLTITPSCTTTSTGPCGPCATPMYACGAGACAAPCGYGGACGYGGCVTPCGTSCGRGTTWRPANYLLPWRRNVAASLWGTSPCGPYGGCR